MEVEAKELQAQPENDGAHGNDAVSDQETNRGRPIDRFYSERNDPRPRDAFSGSITYLEEKCIFRLNEDSEDGEGGNTPLNSRRHVSMTMNRMMGRTTAIIHAGQDLAGFGGAPLPGRFPAHAHSGLSLPRSTFPSRGNLGRSSSQVDMRAHFPKVSVKIHRHLLDQHLLGRPSVNDGDGVMVAAPVSLSADFFHPYFSFLPNQYRQEVSTSAVATNVNPSNSGVLSSSYLNHWNHQVDTAVEGLDLAVLNGGMVGHILPDMGAAVAGGAPLNVHLSQRRADDSNHDEPPLGHSVVVANGPNAFEMPLNQVAPPRRQPLVPHFAPRRDSIPSSQDPHLVLSNVDLEVYSAASSSSNGIDGRETKFQLQQRFAAYHKCLETLLSHDDSVGFQECILDFWDEFFAETANIHYYDRHTAVPRISRLDTFLTKPCPKAIGIVQCEIERIKLSSKKKGVNMKGRFFPTYEYRLFIRNRAPESVEGESPERPRRDTVIMMAKNRGRKQASAGSKKGANNYYLYMPQQEDVVDHFNVVNKAEKPTTTIPNGASEGPTPGDVSVLLGRLQSNFIGTEFQIFSPRVRKQPPGPASGRSSSRPAYSCGMSSDDDLDYDSGVCSDNPASSRRRSRSRGRFSRLSRRRSSLSTPGGNDDGETVNTTNSVRRQIRRTRSSSDVPSYSRPSRTSRRAISNAAVTERQRPQAAFYEEEDGAITYTANLLGSRPRIMDVCIPKVSNEGPASSEWKKYLENCDDVDVGAPNRMLNRFKQLQQRMENEEQGNIMSNEERAPVDESPDGYTPPDDFGLLVLQNRPPWWNVELGSFVLNFGGRVSVASVKNFQLCDRNDQDYIMLQFGRIQGRHSFTMDFQYPLTAVQAFAIAISSLQSKISFG
jgi:hypothetical protein